MAQKLVKENAIFVVPLIYKFHFVCKCSFFSEARSKVINPYYTNRPIMFKFCPLMKSTNDKIIKNLCRFIEIVFRSFN